MSQPGPCLNQPPVSVVTYLDRYATFQCSVMGANDIIWFVNNSNVQSLPQEYGATSTPEISPISNCLNSTLRILAIEKVNNSQIQCAVGINGRLNRTYFSSTALLQVQGNDRWSGSRLACVGKFFLFTVLLFIFLKRLNYNKLWRCLILYLLNFYWSRD